MLHGIEQDRHNRGWGYGWKKLSWGKDEVPSGENAMREKAQGREGGKNGNSERVIQFKRHAAVVITLWRSIRQRRYDFYSPLPATHHQTTTDALPSFSH